MFGMHLIAKIYHLISIMKKLFMFFNIVEVWINWFNVIFCEYHFYIQKHIK